MAKDNSGLKRLESLRGQMSPEFHESLKEIVRIEERMKQHNEQTTKQIEALTKDNKKLEQHNEHTTKQIEALTTRDEQTTKQIEALTTRDEQKTKQIEALIKNNKELKTDLESLKSKNLQQKQRGDEHDKLIGKLQEDSNRYKMPEKGKVSEGFAKLASGDSALYEYGVSFYYALLKCFVEYRGISVGLWNMDKPKMSWWKEQLVSGIDGIIKEAIGRAIDSAIIQNVVNHPLFQKCLSQLYENDRKLKQPQEIAPYLSGQQQQDVPDNWLYRDTKKLKQPDTNPILSYFINKHEGQKLSEIKLVNQAIRPFVELQDLALLAGQITLKIIKIKRDQILEYKFLIEQSSTLMPLWKKYFHKVTLEKFLTKNPTIRDEALRDVGKSLDYMLHNHTKILQSDRELSDQFVDAIANPPIQPPKATDSEAKPMMCQIFSTQIACGNPLFNKPELLRRVCELPFVTKSQVFNTSDKLKTKSEFIRAAEANNVKLLQGMIHTQLLVGNFLNNNGQTEFDEGLAQAYSMSLMPPDEDFGNPEIEVREEVDIEHQSSDKLIDAVYSSLEYENCNRPGRFIPLEDFRRDFYEVSSLGGSHLTQSSNTSESNTEDNYLPKKSWFSGIMRDFKEYCQFIAKRVKEADRKVDMKADLKSSSIYLDLLSVCKSPLEVVNIFKNIDYSKILSSKLSNMDVKATSGNLPPKILIGALIAWAILKILNPAFGEESSPVEVNPNDNNNPSLVGEGSKSDSGKIDSNN